MIFKQLKAHVSMNKVNELQKKVLEWRHNGRHKIVAKEIFLFCHDNSLSIPNDILKCVIDVLRKECKDHREIHPKRRITDDRNRLLYFYVNFWEKHAYDRSKASLCRFFSLVWEKRISQYIEYYQQNDFLQLSYQHAELVAEKEKCPLDQNTLEKAYQRFRKKLNSLK